MYIFYLSNEWFNSWFNPLISDHFFSKNIQQFKEEENCTTTTSTTTTTSSSSRSFTHSSLDYTNRSSIIHLLSWFITSFLVCINYHTFYSNERRGEERWVVKMLKIITSTLYSSFLFELENDLQPIFSLKNHVRWGYCRVKNKNYFNEFLLSELGRYCRWKRLLIFSVLFLIVGKLDERSSFRDYSRDYDGYTYDRW